MRADEPDINNAIRIIDPHHNAILVTGDVEHRATVVENARVADVSLHVRRRRPIGSSNLPVALLPVWREKRGAFQALIGQTRKMLQYFK